MHFEWALIVVELDCVQSESAPLASALIASRGDQDEPGGRPLRLIELTRTSGAILFGRFESKLALQLEFEAEQ